MFKTLFFLFFTPRAQRRSIRVPPIRVRFKLALTGPHLMDARSGKLLRCHESPACCEWWPVAIVIRIVAQFPFFVDGFPNCFDRVIVVRALFATSG